VLVEVLPAEEYEWAHLPGAVSVPLKNLDDTMEQLDRSRPVIVYCHDSLLRHEPASRVAARSSRVRLGV
jgi:rhodanese-related sulfurtransferase